MITIPFSKEKADAWINSCLYGLPFGPDEHKEMEHIQAELKRLGVVEHGNIEEDKARLEYSIREFKIKP